MNLETEKQKFVAKLNEIVFDERLPETVSRHSGELIVEMKRLINDDESSSSKLLDHIEYGLVEHEFPWGKEKTFGFRVKEKNELLSDLMHTFENLIGDELPSSFKEFDPKISHEEWKAVIRMAIDVMTALDRRVLKDNEAGANGIHKGAI